MIALDTNLLIYAHRSGAGQHAAAISAVRRASRDKRGWGVALPAVAEFWRVITHPRFPGGASTPGQAQSFLESVWQLGATCWHPLPGLERRLAAVARAGEVRGNRIFDLQIAVVAREAGAVEIWTHDGGFATVPGLSVRDPLAEWPMDRA